MKTIQQRLRRNRGDEGFTLTELVVTMSIMGVLIALVATVVVQAYRLQSRTVSRENDTTDVQLAVDTMGRALRLATYMSDVAPAGSKTDPPNLPAFTQTDPASVTFTSLVGAAPDPSNTQAATDPVRIRYSLAGGLLTQTVFTPTTTGAGKLSSFGTTGTSRVLARNVVTSSSAPLFSYVYLQPDNSLSTTPPAVNASLLVRQVRIQLTIDSDGGGLSSGTTVDTTVINLNLNS